MSGIGTVLYKSVEAATKPFSKTAHTRFSSYGRFFSSISSTSLPTEYGIHTSNKQKVVEWSTWGMGRTKARMLPCLSSSATYLKRYSNSNQQIKMSHFRNSTFPICVNMPRYSRSCSSHAGSKKDTLENAVSSAVGRDASSSKTSDFIGNEWLDTLKDTVVIAGKKAKDASDEVLPLLQQLYDSNPYLQKVLVPVGGTLSATLLAWFVMPRVLRRLHVYASRSPFSLLSGSLTKEQVPYEKSIWHALEDPARYLVTFMAFSQLGVIIAPSTLELLPQVWRGAIVLSFVWFLQRWKASLFSSAMANRVTAGLDSENLLALEKMSSVGLFVLGAMALAESCGVPVQSILAIGGIGGVATAFASKDILGNLFSGISLQFSKPFSVGDYIKAGTVEGHVADMGLTTTTLLSPDLVIVPNSLFSSQVIVNRSRARWRASVTRIPVRIDDIHKIPLVSEKIRQMLRANANVFLEKDAPYCFTSRIDNSCAEITLGCNLKKMKKDEVLAAEEEILQQAVRIIKEHDIQLGSPLPP